MTLYHNKLIFEGKTCVIGLVYGPFQSNYARNYKSKRNP